MQLTPFGVLLRQYRHNARLTQQGLAERAGLSLRGVSDLERGVRRAPYRHTVRQLADALELPPADREALIDAGRQAGGERAVIHTPSLPSNLPEPLTSFIGREGEVSEVRRLLEHSRLLTLHGPGGVGKTRLAVEVARLVASEYADGVAFVDLAPVSDDALLPASVGSALNVPESDVPVSSIVAELRSKQLLLVLDNCEHLAAACAELVHRLLQDCRTLHILATSRETLGTAGELVWHVPSLSFPPADSAVVLEDVVGYAAVRLFVERAQLFQPGFVLAEGSARTVAEICRVLDGIPLAIELAAALVRVLAPAQIASRLGDVFALLVGGGRTVPSRHQTLRAAVQWSYDLLTPAEQRVFARASVFAGGWTLEASETVLAGRGIDTRSVLDLLTHLVDKSLVLVDSTLPTSVRYWLHETLRQFALEKLEQFGEREASRRRHAAYYLALAEQAVADLRGSNQQAWLDRLEQERDNLRAALRWTFDVGDADLSQRLVGALAPFWELRGYLREGLAWLTRALELPGSPPRVRATALLGAAHLAHFGGASVELERACVEESLTLWRHVQDQRGIADSLRTLGNTLLTVGGDGLDEAEPMLLESLTLFRALDDTPGEAGCLSSLANLAWARGELDRATHLFTECLTLARQQADTWQSAYALHALGHLAFSTGDHTLALSLLGEALWLSVDGDDRRGISVCLQSLALLASARAAPARAARLFGAAAAVRKKVGVGMWGRRWLRMGEAAKAVSVELGDGAYDAAWAAGGALSLDEAVGEALTQESDRASRVLQRGPLTARESEVALLVAKGLTNRRIGEKLVITEGTAALHVRHILNKLGFHSRAQIAAWVATRA